MSSHPAGPPLRTIVALTVVSAMLSVLRDGAGRR